MQRGVVVWRRGWWPFMAAAAMASTAAAANVPASPDWEVRSWEMSDLLMGEDAESSVRGLWPMADASLVIATTEGLLRFDGRSFTGFPVDVPVGESQLVGRVMPGGPGETLVAFGTGRVESFVGGDQTSIAAGAKAFEHNLVTAAARAADGSLWVLHASDDEASLIRRISAGREERIGAIHGIGPDDRPSSLAVDTLGRIWISCGGELRIFRDGRFEVAGQLPASRVTIARASGGGVWAAAKGGIYACDGREPPRKLPMFGAGLSPLRSNDAILSCRALLEDSAGRLWISSSRYGLYVLDDGRLQQVLPGETWTTEAVEDADGTIWVGTRLAIHRIRPSLVWPSEQPTWRPIRSLAADGRGAMWFVTHLGELGRHDPDSDAPASTIAEWFPEEPGVGKAAICVASRGDGTTWVGLSSGEVLRHAGGRFTRIPPPTGLEGRAISGLCAASAGDLWATIDDHLLRFHEERWQVVAEPPTRTGGAPAGEAGLRDLIAQDAPGHVWAVCGERLLRATADGNDVETVGSSEAGSVRALYAAPDGDVWIAVDRRGLLRWRDGVWATVDEARGLASNTISGMAADGIGRLWCTASRLMFAVDLAELNRVADGAADLCHCWRLPATDEYPFLESISYPRCPLVLDDGGRLLVPRQTGMAVCEPSRLAASRPVPVTIERVERDRLTRWRSPPAQAIGGAPAVVPVSAGSRSVGVALRAATLASPTNLRVEYRLDGIDGEWHEADLHDTVVYASLPAGEHGFHVRSSTDAGTWEADGPAVVLVVDPPFHETWWFRAVVLGFVAFLAATVAAAAIRQRAQRGLAIVRQETAVEQERIRLARDMHDAIGTNLTQIALLAEVAKDADEAEQEEHLDTVARISRDTVAALDELVWEVNPGNDDLQHLLGYVCGYASETLRRFGIACHVERPETIPALPATAGFRRGVLLLVKEAITNVLAHAGASEVKFRVAADGGRLRISISDDGVGLDPARAEAGDGLGNMRQRAAELGGRSWLETGTAGGTTVYTDLPLASAARPSP
jgi:signal transduction histidine kinase/ligand-binding sensor domain-containing protein